MTRPLIVALHGVGSNARDMAATLAPLSAHAEVLALDGPEPFDGGGWGGGQDPRARQWFSVAGVTGADRPARIAQALPPLIARLDAIAAERGLSRDDLIPLGFSQGAMMTLAMIAGGLHRGRAIAVSGRLAAPVLATPGPARLLLIHDRNDPMMPLTLSVEAKTALTAAGHRVDSFWTAGLGHQIGQPSLFAIDRWLAADAPLSSALADPLEGHVQ
jgi:phospholipase/carboxylesterase